MMFFLISLGNVTMFLYFYFDHLPSAYYANIICVTIIFLIQVYLQEKNSRKIFMMYREKEVMEEKSATILKLFPESLSIVNL